MSHRGALAATHCLDMSPYGSRVSPSAGAALRPARRGAAGYHHPAQGAAGGRVTRSTTTRIAPTPTKRHRPIAAGHVSTRLAVVMFVLLDVAAHNRRAVDAGRARPRDRRLHRPDRLVQHLAQARARRRHRRGRGRLHAPSDRRGRGHRRGDLRLVPHRSRDSAPSSWSPASGTLSRSSSVTRRARTAARSRRIPPASCRSSARSRPASPSPRTASGRSRVPPPPATRPRFRVSIIPFVLAILRYAHLIEQGKGGAPEDLVLSDRVLQVLGLLWLITFAVGVNV